jgi:hypothetical protein
MKGCRNSTRKFDAPELIYYPEKIFFAKLEKTVEYIIPI